MLSCFVWLCYKLHRRHRGMFFFLGKWCEKHFKKNTPRRIVDHSASNISLPGRRSLKQWSKREKPTKNLFFWKLSRHNKVKRLTISCAVRPHHNLWYRNMVFILFFLKRKKSSQRTFKMGETDTQKKQQQRRRWRYGETGYTFVKHLRS